MSNSNFKSLTKEQQDARIAQYKAEDAKYNLKEGLFTLTHVARNEDKVLPAFTKAGNKSKTKTNTFASFGFNVIPVKDYDSADFDGSWTWVNQLIDTTVGAKVVDAMEQLASEVNPKGKSVLVQIKYKVREKDGAKFINVNQVYRRSAIRTSKKAAGSAASAQPAANNNPLPY